MGTAVDPHRPVRTRGALTLALITILATALGACSLASSVARPARRARPAPGTSPAPTPAPAIGQLRSVSIPATSTFAARKALIYLPPAALAGRRMPVLELLHGVPGGPTDWLTTGGLLPTLNAFATSHGGRAPVIVMPDINGAKHADTECVRTTTGADVEQYLTTDVPDYVMAHEPVSQDRRQWAIAGLSEGGTCAAVLALRHFPQYRAFVDLSGLVRPTVGDKDDPQATIAELFGGSVSEYQQHDPIWLLQHQQYPGLAAWLACGTNDAQVRADQPRLAAAASAADVTVHTEVVPGRHSWPVWAVELRRVLPWLWNLVSGTR